jgi:hypothetical protein
VTRLIVLAALAGCSSGARSGGSPAPQPGGPAPAEAAAAAAAPAADATAFFTPEVTAVLRASGDNVPVVGYVSRLVPSPPACWTKLRGAIAAGYQLQLGAAGSYFVFEGALPREEVEQCVPAALAGKLPVTVERDGELVAFHAGGVGTVHAAWRGSVVVAGSKEQVTRALAAGTAEVGRAWRERLAQLPPGLLAAWSGDLLLTNLFGVATTSYLFVIDRAEKTPAPFFSGRVIARYGSAGDAAVAARRIKQGELYLATPAPAELVYAFTRMKVRQAGAVVEIGFDADMFDGVDLEQLQQWLRGAAGARP